MTAVVDELRRARAEWLAGAARAHFGRCESCLRTHEANGRPLLVARQPRRRRFECFPCSRGAAVRKVESL